jgi:hypothetical protein
MEDSYRFRTITLVKLEKIARKFYLIASLLLPPQALPGLHSPF